MCYNVLGDKIMLNKVYESIKKFLKENYKFLIAVILLIIVCNYELPFIIYRSGGTIDVKERVKIDKEFTQKGSLSMSYVTAMKGSIPIVLLSYIIPDWDLMPLKEVTVEDDFDKAIETGKVYLQEGIDNAIIAAFNESDYDIKITKTINSVIYLSESAKTDAKVGDEIISINKHKVTSLDDLKEYINTLKEGDKVAIKVENNGKQYERYAYVYYEKEDKSLKIGLAFKPRYEYETEIPVDIKMKDSESGSSGGLMMALQVYNALTEDDITKGYDIAGTGTIESDGTVGEIGGVKYKVLGASKNGMDIFFCPKENYKEAVDVKTKRDLDIDIIKVSTLEDAIEYLNNL